MDIEHLRMEHMAKLANGHYQHGQAAYLPKGIYGIATLIHSYPPAVHVAAIVDNSGEQARTATTGCPHLRVLSTGATCTSTLTTSISIILATAPPASLLVVSKTSEDIRHLGHACPKIPSHTPHQSVLLRFWYYCRETVHPITSTRRINTNK